MQLKKHIKRAYGKQTPCRKCGGNHATGQHGKLAPAPEVEDDDE